MEHKTLNRGKWLWFEMTSFKESIKQIQLIHLITSQNFKPLGILEGNIIL